MTTIIYILIAILVFGILIFVHELGHFLMAKANNIYVCEFSMGMGPRIFSFDKGETKYSLKVFPIGGSCAMLGEDEDSEDERAFGNKKLIPRMLVLLGGPFFNFIFAFLVAIVLIGLAGYDPAVIGEVAEGSPAYEAGLKADDTIIKINNSRIYNYRELQIYMQVNSDGSPIDFQIKRDGEIKNITVVPKLNEEAGYYLVGVYGAGRQKAGFLTNIKYSVLEIRYQIKTTFISLRALFSGKVSVNNLSGPVGIVSMMSQTMEEVGSQGTNMDVFVNVLNFAILLSASLGVMNLLPLPALDGGRFAFLVLEAIRRKKVPADKEAMVHFVGILLLFALSIAIMFNDIRKLFI